MRITTDPRSDQWNADDFIGGPRYVGTNLAKPDSTPAEGVTIEGTRYGSIDANLERRTGRNCWIELSLTEGKNREVRNVLAHLGLQVSRLIRTSYGPFTAEGLAPGTVAEVQREDLFRFRQSLK